MDEAEEAFVDAAEERHLEAQALAAEPRYAASVLPIAEAWAKAHVLALHLAAKIEADVERTLGASPLPSALAEARGAHPLLGDWAKAYQDADDAEQVLLAIWPVLVTRDGHPDVIKAPGGAVRLVRALKPTIRWEAA